MENKIEQAVQLLISGQTAIVTDDIKKEVQRRLRGIKSNCTLVLKQLNDKNF
jgi:hypothetical protein